MSVYFHSDIKNEKRWTRDYPCLCTQNTPEFVQGMKKMTPELRQGLKMSARPECHICHGSGIEMTEESDAPFLNLANMNAEALFAMLGLPPDHLLGTMTTAEARRGIMRAKARGDLSPYTRPRSMNRRGGGVVIASSAARCIDVGLNEEQLRARLRRFEDFLEESISRGATHIWWD